MYVVGITGHARAGKDTIADWFVGTRGAVRESFAQPMKDAISYMFGLDEDAFTNPAKKEAPVPGMGRSPRYLAQTLGTQWGRDLIHPDVWIRAVVLRVNSLPAPPKALILSDVRFENEANWIRKSGVLIHVHRNGADGAVGIPGHASEAGVSVGVSDVVIPNNGTVKELYALLDDLFSSPLGATVQ